MQIGVIGAGLQGGAAARELARLDDVAQVRLGDLDAGRARRVAAQAADDAARLEAGALDAADPGQLSTFLAGLDVVVSAASYRLHLAVTRAAIAAGVHCCDLGGNTGVVDAQRALDREARAAGVTVVPDCGLAPGLASVLAALAIERHGAARSLTIRVGGLPRAPRPPLGYALLFAPEGLVNEYNEPCRILRDGRVVEVEPLTGVEAVDFPPLGTLEAFHTSGGSSTLPQTYAGRLQALDYKTLRYPGHCERVRLLRDLGLMEEKRRRLGDGVELAPRRLLEILLAERLPVAAPGTDVALVRVVAAGPRHGRPARHLFELVDHGDPARGLSAMMRATALPLAVVAHLLGRGCCRGPGVVPQETAVPGGLFLDALRARGLDIREHEADG